ncbi:MAG: hypothetical protein IE890_12370 [Arcobacter sp.]|nr:hypothetical protein [Arcobacter sp.]
MKIGNIFKAIVGEDPKNMDIQTIEAKAIKQVSFKYYGNNVVSSRGSIFKNSLFNIDAKLDKKLSSL